MAVVIRGVVLDLHDSPDYVSDVIRRTGDFYEAAILDEIAERVHGGTLIDVGAMIGNHTAYLARFVACDSIHAFEPLPANLALLRVNVGDDPLVTVHELALSDEPGELFMAASPDNYGHATIAPVGEPVDARTLDSFGFQDVTLLKVDVEGHERYVLAGAQDTIARCRPIVVIEDWPGKGYPDLLPGYRLAVEWADSQTYLYEPS